MIVGAGISGQTAVVSAGEAGAKIILLEKGSTYNFCGAHNAALNCNLQKKEEISVDRDKVIATIMEWREYRVDQRVYQGQREKEVQQTRVPSNACLRTFSLFD